MSDAVKRSIECLLQCIHKNQIENLQVFLFDVIFTWCLQEILCRHEEDQTQGLLGLILTDIRLFASKRVLSNVTMYVTVIKITLALEMRLKHEYGDALWV
jgi:hypothetical protein